MDRGAYVPDDLTNALIADRLARTDTDHDYLLDGYLRTTDQMEYLDQLLARHGQRLEHVVHLQVDVEELIARLLQRAGEQGRRDDTEAVIRRRRGLRRGDGAAAGHLRRPRHPDHHRRVR